MEVFADPGFAGAAAVFFATGAAFFAGVVAATLAVLLLAAFAAAVRFWRAPEAGRGKIFELISGLWTLALYLSLGLIPLCLRQWK